VVGEVALLLAIVYVPFLEKPMGTFAFSSTDWLLAVGLAATIVPVVEGVKWMTRRGWFGDMT